MNLCPCRECRPKGETLKAAKKRIVYAALVRQFGTAGADQRVADQRARLQSLRRSG